MNITGYTLNADITLIAASEDNNYFRLLNRLIEALEAYADAPKSAIPEIEKRLGEIAEPYDFYVDFVAPSDGKLGGYKAVLYP